VNAHICRETFAMRVYACVYIHVSANGSMTSDGYRLIAFFGRGFKRRDKESERREREKDAKMHEELRKKDRAKDRRKRSCNWLQF